MSDRYTIGDGMASCIVRDSETGEWITPVEAADLLNDREAAIERARAEERENNARLLESIAAGCSDDDVGPYLIAANAVRQGYL